MGLADKILENEEYRRLLREIEDAECDRIFCKHDLSHCLDVARVATLMCIDRGWDIPKDLIYAASLLHDIGRAGEYRDGSPHDEAGVSIARSILSSCRADEDDIRDILKAISEHRGTDTAYHGDTAKTGRAALAGLIKEADKLSRPCMLCRARDVCKWPEDKKNKIMAL